MHLVCTFPEQLHGGLVSLGVTQMNPFGEDQFCPLFPQLPPLQHMLTVRIVLTAGKIETVGERARFGSLNAVKNLVSIGFDVDHSKEQCVSPEHNVPTASPVFQSAIESRAFVFARHVWEPFGGGWKRDSGRGRVD